MEDVSLIGNMKYQNEIEKNSGASICVLIKTITEIRNAISIYVK